MEHNNFMENRLRLAKILGDFLESRGIFVDSSMSIRKLNYEIEPGIAPDLPLLVVKIYARDPGSHLGFFNVVSRRAIIENFSQHNLDEYLGELEHDLSQYDSYRDIYNSKLYKQLENV